MKKKWIVLLFGLCLLLTGCNHNYVQVTVDTPYQVVATNFYTLSVRNDQGNTLYNLEVRPALYGNKMGTLKAEANQNLAVMVKISPSLYLSSEFNEKKLALIYNETRLEPSQTWHYGNSMDVLFSGVKIENTHGVFLLIYS